MFIRCSTNVYETRAKTRYKSHNAVEEEIIELHIDTHPREAYHRAASGLLHIFICLLLNVMFVYIRS